MDTGLFAIGVSGSTRGSDEETGLRRVPPNSQSLEWPIYLGSRSLDAHPSKGQAQGDTAVDEWMKIHGIQFHAVYLVWKDQSTSVAKMMGRRVTTAKASELAKE